MMNRDELNEIYRELENRMHKIIAPFTSLHKGLCIEKSNSGLLQGVWRFTITIT